MAVEAMHCCRETKANVAEKLRGKDEARGVSEDECRRTEKSERGNGGRETGTRIERMG